MQIVLNMGIDAREVTDLSMQLVVTGGLFFLAGCVVLSAALLRVAGAMR